VKQNTIVVNGVSKSFSMTGWRVGYLAGDKEMVKKVITLQSHSTSNPCSISQAAAECAIDSDLEGIIKKNCDEFQERRNFLMEGLSGQDKVVPFNPQGAFYLFCDVSGCGMDSLTFSKRILEEKKVAVIPGGPFGEDSYIRLSFATDLAAIEKGVNRIKDWVKGL